MPPNLSDMLTERDLNPQSLGCSPIACTVKLSASTRRYRTDATLVFFARNDRLRAAGSVAGKR